MKIDKDTAVTLRFSVTDAAGKVIDKGTEPMEVILVELQNDMKK